MLQRRKIQSQT